MKKRVERDRDDTAYVVTTYEGTHNHVSPSTVYYASQDAASGRFFVAGTHPPPSGGAAYKLCGQTTTLKNCEQQSPSHKYIIKTP